MTKTRKMMKAVIVIVLIIGIVLGGLFTTKMLMFYNATGLGEVSITAQQKGVEKHNFIENEKLVLAHKLCGDETVMTLTGNPGVIDNVTYNYYSDGAIDITL